MATPQKANPKQRRPRTPAKANDKSKVDAIAIAADDLKLLKSYHRQYTEAAKETESRYNAMLKAIGEVREEAEIPDGYNLNPKTWYFEKAAEPDEGSDEDRGGEEASDAEAEPTDPKPEVGKPDVKRTDPDA